MVRVSGQGLHKRRPCGTVWMERLKESQRDWSPEAEEVVEGPEQY